YSAAAPAGAQTCSKAHCSQRFSPFLNGSTPRGTKIKVRIMPIADAVTVMVHDSCHVPAAAAMADRITGPRKFARLNIWVISPITADGEPPAGAISTAWRVTVVGTSAPTNENIAAAIMAQMTVPGTLDQSGANTIVDMIAM